MLDNLKSVGRRLLSAMVLPKVSEVQELDKKLAAHALDWDMAGQPVAVTPEQAEELGQRPTNRADRRRRNRFRCSRNKKFHAKLGGLQQYGFVAHETANSKWHNTAHNQQILSLVSSTIGQNYNSKGVA